MKTIDYIPHILILLSAATLIAGQDAGTTSSGPTPAGNGASIATDAIFSDIMRSLSKENRAVVDSAAHAATTVSGNANEIQRPLNADSVALARQEQEQTRAALDKLPQQLRKQVEQAIRQIEQTKQERKIELKEMRGGH